ncbi:Minor fimbrial protein prsF precursor [Serratia fonticola]|uniref:fimbrial protein n=1 Tax=Serratia fonticola TaxID=47917 RepID=UPI00217A3AD6|nr:fimbrial protein [Serratia fonticola]CAI2045220.1 Minor fimbrial protein prsF precursor [Serratia fonticola]
MGASNSLHAKMISAMLAAMVISAGLPALADQKGDSVAVTFTGVIKRKPCHISNDRVISISFGNVGVHKVDGTQYTKPIPYTLKCDEESPGLTLKLTVRGAQTMYDKAAIATTAPNLGIRILQNDQPMDINRGIPVNYQSPPDLKAVPVQNPGNELSEGQFRATATLLAEYD